MPNKDATLSLRVREPEIYGYIYKTMAETNITMQDLLKDIIVHCKNDPKFVVPLKAGRAMEKQMSARLRKLERYKSKARQGDNETCNS